MFLAVGVFHGELTSLLWGGAFGFAWLYAAAAGAWSARRLRRSLPQAHPEASASPPTLTFRSDPVPAAPPLFSWRLRVEGRHSATRHFVRVLPRDAASLAPELPRGRYQVSARWELADWFGFTRLTVPALETVDLTVEPADGAFTPPEPPRYRAGTGRPRRSGRRAGDPFDVRHYVPGDDLRRLHWPLYAHSDSLFVRTAEPIPPPTGHQYVVLDLDAPSESVLDARLASLTGWLSDLDARGTGWTLAVPAADLTLTRGEAWKPALAGLHPAPLPEEAPPWPEFALLTGSGPAAARLAARARIRPVVVPEPRPAPPPHHPWWRRR